MGKPLAGMGAKDSQSFLPSGDTNRAILTSAIISRSWRLNPKGTSDVLSVRAVR